LDAAQVVTDLLIPPINHLEALSGDREGQYSIRINDQCRICFPFMKDRPRMPKSPNTTAKFPPVHPGEILRETLDDLGLSMNQLAQAIHVPANRVSAIVAGKRSITGETALRLARYFATTPAYWMNLQALFDLESARDEWDTKVKAEIRPRTAA
jgi:addiction module HigA family antidote